MPKVLVVDDAIFMRVSIRNMLEKHGYEIVAEAENGEIAVEKFKEFDPDIVTMDITMPEMNGIEALKQIKGLNPKAKVIMLSAMGQEAMVKQAIVHGAATFIVKPFKEDHVLQTVAKIAAM